MGPDLPQLILRDRTDKQQRQCIALVTWEVLRASLNTSLSCGQQQAEEVHLPSIVAGSDHQSWIAVLEQYALLGSNSQSIYDTAVDSSEEWELSDPIKHSIINLCDYTEPLTPTLAEPLLHTAQSQEGLASQLMHATPKPRIPDHLPVACAKHSVIGSCKATYCSLVGQDMELQDTVSTLPVVLFDGSSDHSPYGMDEAESREDTWQQCMADCHIRQLKTGHLKLYMDWSLSDCSASSSKTLQGYRRHLDQTLRPTILPSVPADSTVHESLSTAFVANRIAGAEVTPSGVQYNAVRQPEQLPHAVKARLQNQAQHAKQPHRAQHADLVQGSQLMTSTSSAQPAVAVAAEAASGTARTNPPPGAAAELPSETGGRTVPPANPGRPSAYKSKAPQQTQATGVFQKRHPSGKAQVSAKRQVESAGNDMAFFLGLQQGAAPNHSALKTLQPRAPTLASAAPDPGRGHALEAGQSQVLDLCSGDASEDEGDNMKLPDVQFSILCLPERHQGLLQRMQEEHTAVLRHNASIGAEVRVTYEQLLHHLIQVTIVCMHDYAEEPQPQPSLFKLSVLKLISLTTCMCSSETNLGS